MSQESQTGLVRISNDVVTTIAGMAALEVPGIAAMSGGISEGIAKRLSGKSIQKGITVEVGQQEAAIDLRIIVQYGSSIQKICTELQHTVRDTVENMTGLSVVEVNVKVDGVAFREEEKASRADELLRVK